MTERNPGGVAGPLSTGGAGGTFPNLSDRHDKSGTPGHIGCSCHPPARAMSDAEADPGHGPEQPTVLVRMSPEVVRQLERAGWAFGEPDAEGFHSPVVYFVDLPAPAEAAGSLDVEQVNGAAVVALVVAIDRLGGSLSFTEEDVEAVLDRWPGGFAGDDDFDADGKRSYRLIS